MPQGRSGTFESIQRAASSLVCKDKGLKHLICHADTMAASLISRETARRTNCKAWRQAQYRLTLLYPQTFAHLEAILPSSQMQTSYEEKKHTAQQSGQQYTYKSVGLRTEDKITRIEVGVFWPRQLCSSSQCRPVGNHISCQFDRDQSLN